MAFVKGQSGNPGGKRKERLFRNALVMELKAAGEDMPDLRAIARGLIERAKENNGDCRELADRIDGKVAQPVVGDDEEDAINVIHRIERIIVSPPNPDSGSVPPATEPSSV